MRRLCSIAAVLLITSLACVAATKPTRSEYLLSTNAGITFAEGRGAFYLMTFDVLKPSTGRLYVLVQYENPEDRNAPLIDDLYLPPGAKELELQSPSFKVVKNRSRYKVELSLYADDQHKVLLGKHRQDVDFEVPREMVTQISQQFEVFIR